MIPVNGLSRLSSEQESALKTLNPLIKAESRPIHHPENTLQVWVSCSKYGRQISKTHSETKAFHSSFCFSKSLNTVTLAVSCCSMNNVVNFNAAAAVSRVRGGRRESQRKDKRGSDDRRASQKMLHLSCPVIDLTLRRVFRLHFYISWRYCTWKGLITVNRETTNTPGSGQILLDLCSIWRTFLRLLHHFLRERQTLMLYVWYAVLVIKDRRHGWPAELAKRLQTQNIQHRTLKSCPCVGGRLKQ